MVLRMDLGSALFAYALVALVTFSQLYQFTRCTLCIMPCAIQVTGSGGFEPKVEKRRACCYAPYSSDT